MEHAFSLLAIPHTFCNTEECKNDFAWAVSFPFGSVFTFEGRFTAVVSVYHWVPWAQGTFRKIHFHSRNRNYYHCKDTNILIKTFSFQKSFQLTVTVFKYKQGKSADFCLSCTRSSLQSWSFYMICQMIKWKISSDFVYVEAKKLSCVLQHVLQHQAWCLMTYAADKFGSNVPATPPTAARGLSNPSGALLRVQSWSSSVRTLTCVVWRCQQPHSLMLSLLGLFAQREVSQSRSVTGSSGSLLYPHLCLLHTVEVSNGLAWHHRTLGTVMERSDPENMQVCRWFYSYE